MVARRVGKDPGAILQRVRRVRSEIYPGVFRGPVATLADGAGNDYDRALLLHDLILAADSGSSVRYAFCSLSADQATAAVSAARAAYIAPALAARAEALAARASNEKARSRYSHIGTFWKDVTGHARQQTTELAADFQKVGASLQAADGANLQAIAAHHVWVQLLSQGAWLDLDPSTPDGTPGHAACVAATTSDALPAGAFDTVTATLSLESREGTAQKSATVASGTWRTEDLAYATLAFAFAESSELHAAAPQPQGQLAFTPLLVAGQQTTAAAPIQVPAPAAGEVSKSAAKGASQVLDAFGDAAPPPPAPTPVAPAVVPVALRLDVSVAAPDVAPATVERPIFDRVSAADRAAGRATTAALKDQPLYAFGTVWSIAINYGTGVVGAGDYSKIDPRSDDPAALVRALGATHRAYYTLRRAAFADAAGPSASPIASARAGVSFLGLAPYAAGVTDFGLSMDRAREGAHPDGGPADASLAWGVASVYGERLAVALPQMMRASNLNTLPFDDSIEMFYIARHSNIPPTFVRSPGDVAALSASADAKARLSTSLGGGASAVVPSAQVPYGGASDNGWWILAPNGAVFDEMQSGMHQTLIERAKIAWEDVKMSIQIRKQGLIIRCAGMAAAGMMGIASGMGGEGAELAELDAEMIHAIYESNEIEEMIEAASECEI
jgi:hypothetical protein